MYRSTFRYVGSMTIERIAHNGHLVISRNGYKQTYIGYSQKQAIAEFRQAYRKQKGKG